MQADPGLGVVAGAYAGDMITGDFFGHFAPDGRDLGARLAEANLGHYDKVAEILWDASDSNIDWRIEETVRSSVTDWLRSRRKGTAKPCSTPPPASSASARPSATNGSSSRCCWATGRVAREDE